MKRRCREIAEEIAIMHVNNINTHACQLTATSMCEQLRYVISIFRLQCRHLASINTEVDLPVLPVLLLTCS